MSLSRDLVLSFVKLHILYHAGKKPIYGMWMMEELAEHGYDFSAGTLYPMLHTMEDDGLLESEKQVVDGKMRKYYHLTPAGEEALEQGRQKAIELLEEINKE